MTKRWYVETKNFTGKWKPSIYHQDEQPTEKTFAGPKREVNNVQLITPDLNELSLGELWDHFNGFGCPRQSGNVHSGGAQGAVTGEQ